MSARLPRAFGAVVAALALTAAVAVSPPVAIAGTLAFFAVAFTVYLAAKVPRMFLGALAVILVGYAFLGRAFAYLGVPPLFVGELVLGFGVLGIVVAGGLARVFRSPLAWLLVLYMAWGALQTIPYVGEHGADALRDGAIWGYGMFAILSAAFILRGLSVPGVVAAYARLLPAFACVLPLLFVAYRLFGSQIPYVPITPVGIIDMKAGDVAVHLAGVMVFLALGLHLTEERRSAQLLQLRESFWWLCWLVGFLVAGTGNRGGLLSVLMAGFVVVWMRPFASRWSRPLLLTLLVFTTLFVADVEIQTERRNISVQSLFMNVQSVVLTAQGETADEGTSRWRLNWWADIIDYTLFGPYFWTGKGHGVNLADADGYQVGFDPPLRSPHNSHMTILARSGVPGALFWLVLQGAFALSLLQAYRRRRREGEDWWARVNLWILAWWTAFMVNSTFDVFLEGPPGGIWFWSLLGFGIALLEAQRRGIARPPPVVDDGVR